MIPAFCVVVGIGMKMGVDNCSAADNVCMGKHNRTCVVTCKNHYEQKRYDFLPYHGSKDK